MENRKYEITNNTMEFEGRELHRIRALKNFADVEAGDLGGWVSNENNLSQEGCCWIYDEAKCMDNAKMYDNSRMCDSSEMRDSSEMHGNSEIYGECKMCDETKICGNSIVKIDIT